MSELSVFTTLLIAMFALAVIVFTALFFVTAPYGRHNRKGWGITIDNRMAWILMEAPSPVIFGMLFLAGTNHVSAAMLAFVILWEAHYLHRAFIYPFSLNDNRKRMPVLIMASGMIFNLMNAYLNGRWIFHFSPGYAEGWIYDPRFVIGVVLFAAGFIINRQADGDLRTLRKEGEGGYHVCNRRFYRWISCPNYFGEIVIWTGWAVATWSLPGLAFALWTIANLTPRARAHHLWYRETFPDYPPERKALVPKIW